MRNIVYTANKVIKKGMKPKKGKLGKNMARGYCDVILVYGDKEKANYQFMLSSQILCRTMHHRSPLNDLIKEKRNEPKTNTEGYTVVRLPKELGMGVLDVIRFFSGQDMTFNKSRLEGQLMAIMYLEARVYIGEIKKACRHFKVDLKLPEKKSGKKEAEENGDAKEEEPEEEIVYESEIDWAKLKAKVKAMPAPKCLLNLPSSIKIFNSDANNRQGNKRQTNVKMETSPAKRPRTSGNPRGSNPAPRVTNQSMYRDSKPNYGGYQPAGPVYGQSAQPNGEAMRRAYEAGMQAAMGSGQMNYPARPTYNQPPPPPRYGNQYSQPGPTWRR